MYSSHILNITHYHEELKLLKFMKLWLLSNEVQLLFKCFYH